MNHEPDDTARCPLCGGDGGVSLTDAQEFTSRDRLLERYEAALHNLFGLAQGHYSLLAEQVVAEVQRALNPTEPAKS